VNDKYLTIWKEAALVGISLEGVRNDVSSTAGNPKKIRTGCLRDRSLRLLPLCVLRSSSDGGSHCHRVISVCLSYPVAVNATVPHLLPCSVSQPPLEQ